MASGNSLYWEYDFTVNRVAGYSVKIRVDLASATENVQHGGIGVPHAQMCNIVTPQGNNPMNNAIKVEAVTPPQPPPPMPEVQSEVVQIIVTKLLTPRVMELVDNMVKSKIPSPPDKGSMALKVPLGCYNASGATVLTSASFTDS